MGILGGTSVSEKLLLPFSKGSTGRHCAPWNICPYRFFHMRRPWSSFSICSA